MVDDKIVDKYWLCCNEDGSIWLNSGQKTSIYLMEQKARGKRIPKTYDDMGWLVLNRNSITAMKRGEKISSEDFVNVNFPRVTYEDGPIEIEICKSGKVYWYES